MGGLASLGSDRFLAGNQNFADKRRIELVQLLPGLAAFVFQAQGKRVQRSFLLELLLA
jgi:hypothetical protein